MTKKLFVPEAQYEEGEVIPAYLLEDVVQSAGESTSLSDVRPKPMYDNGYTNEYEDYVAILFYGTSANVVLTGFGESNPYTVMVYLDDMPIKDEFAGEDIKWDSSGNSYVEVIDSRLYRLIKSPDYGGFELKISSNSEKFELFAFTFGSFQN